MRKKELNLKLNENKAFKKQLKATLIKKYLVSFLSIITYLFALVTIILYFIRITEKEYNFIIKINTILANLSVLILFLVLIFKSKKKRENLKILFFQVIFAFVLLLLLIFVFVNSFLSFMNNYIFFIILPFNIFILYVWSSEFFKISDFVRNNYNKFNSGESDSYNLLSKANLVINFEKNCSKLYYFSVIISELLKALGVFVILFFISLLKIKVFYITIAYMFLVESVLLALLTFSCFYIFFLFLKQASNNFSDSNLNNYISYCFLGLCACFSLISFESGGEHYVLLFSLIIASLHLLIILFRNFIFQIKKIEILNAPISNITKNKSDLIMIDEPLNDLELLNGQQVKIIDRLNDVLERTASNVPLNIVLSGDWGCGKTTVIRTLSSRLRQINCYSKIKLNSNDKYKKKYFIINIDLLKFNSPMEVNDYVKNYLNTLNNLFLVNIGKSIDEYFDKMLDLMSDIMPKQVPFFGKLARAEKKKNFVSMEQARQNFQESIKKLLTKSNRQGIILFIDDIDRLEEENYKKMYSLLKEYYNIYGFTSVILKGCEEKQNQQERELTKFINLSYDYSEFENLTEIKNEKNFTNLISIAADCIYQNENESNIDDVFVKFDKKLRNANLFEVLNDIDKSLNKSKLNLRGFENFFVQELKKFRDCKMVLRKCILSKESIIKSFLNIYEEEEKGFNEKFYNALTNYFKNQTRY